MPGGGNPVPPPMPGSPPGGGFAPPPGGGFAPPPGPGGYQVYQPGGMPQGPGQADVGTAISWAIAKFQQYIGPFLGLSGVIAAVSLIGGVVSAKLIDSGADTLVINETTGQLENTGNFFGGLIGGALLSIIVALILVFLRVGLLRAALRTSRGETPSFADLTTGENLGAYIVTAIVVGLLTAVGLVLCVLPGLAVAFFMLFAPTHSLDKGAGVGDAIKWSFEGVKANVVPAIVLVLIAIVAGIISAVAGGVGGAVVAAIIGLFLDPLSALINANLYRQVGNEPIAA